MNSKTISELAERIKCGEIFLLLNEKNFVFSCVSCDASFTQIDDYMKHAKCCLMDIKRNSKIKEDFDKENQYENEDIDERLHENVECVIKTEISNENEINTKSDVISIMSPAPLAVETVFIKENEKSEESSDHSPQAKAAVTETEKRIKKHNSDPSLVCSICKMYLSTKRNLESHSEFCRIMLEHEINMSIYTKDGETTSPQEYDPSNLVAGFSSLTCKICQLRLKCRRDRVEHECKHTGEKLYKCDVCNQSFRFHNSFKEHRKIHEGKKNHKCHLCDAAFTLLSNLQVHIRRHLGEKRYKCRYCEMRFVATTERLHHERTHTGEKPFQCDDCGQCFLTSSKLTLHTMRHTGERPHKCEHCDKRFFSKKLLKDHMVVHSIDRPLSCDVCNATFARKSSLGAHKKIHSNVAKYVCKICNKKFKQGPGLYSHMKSHGTVLKKS